MFFDSKEYSGECSCGKNHRLDTLYCVIESGCLKEIRTYTEKFDIKGIGVAIYDENTYLATGDRHPEVHYEVVLPAEGLHADEHGVLLLSERLPEDAQYLIAIGSGTVHDIVRYCAYKRNIDFVSCPLPQVLTAFVPLWQL